MSNNANTALSTTTLSTATLFTEKDLLGPLRHFPTSVAVTKELLQLRYHLALAEVKKWDPNSGDTRFFGTVMVLDACQWDLEGYLQNN